MTSRKDYDIALIILDEKLTFTENIQAIEMVASSLNPPKPGIYGFLTGFGLVTLIMYIKRIKIIIFKNLFDL